jgi:hypothetical protein
MDGLIAPSSGMTIQAQRHARMPVMKESMRKLLLVAVSAALVGCASSGPVQIGKDTYIITKTSAGGAFVSGASVKTELIQEGVAFCQKKAARPWS